MTSEISDPTSAYVWIWLPGASEPVVAALLTADGRTLSVTYGRSYLGREDAIPLYLPELPLQRGRQVPLPGLDMPGCIADAGPDAWGKRVIMRRRWGVSSRDRDPDELPPLVYLLASGSDRIGALDFQQSADRYVPRVAEQASLAELMDAAERVERGLSLSPVLDEALLRGTTIGGARPKALLSGDGVGDSRIAKFSSTTDPYPVVQAEFVAMELARRVGLDVARVKLVEQLGKYALLVERFDRVPGTTQRRLVVSALTMLGLSEMQGRYATYPELAEQIRARFTRPRETLRELFARITFNVLVGNTDDHARNHAAFWDGNRLTLTPAYDICPQQRSGGEARQAMAIGEDDARWSRLTTCVDAASSYLLSPAAARALIDEQLAIIRRDWDEVCRIAKLTPADKQRMWSRQFLNPFALEGYEH